MTVLNRRRHQPDDMLKKLLRRIPGIRRMREFLLDPVREMRTVVQFLAAMRADRCLRAVSKMQPKQAVLLVSLMGDDIQGTRLEAFFATAFRLGGGRVFVLTNRGSWANAVYRALGIRNMVYLEDHHDLTLPERELIDQGMARLPRRVASMAELLGIAFEGVYVGKYVASTVLRVNHSPEIDFDVPDVQTSLRQAIRESMVMTLAARKVLGAVSPRTVFLLEKGYSPYGEFFDMALASGVDVIQRMGSHTSRSYLLKRYRHGNRDVHPSTLSASTWAQLKDAPWPRRMADAVKAHLRDIYGSGEWFSEVGTQFNARLVEREVVRERLGLRPRKKLAVIFAHIFWDATFFYGRDLFRDYRTWLVETVRAACANNALDWVVKVHPANLVKKNREGYRGEWAEIIAIRQEIGELPPHVRILPPETDISTFSLLSAMDFCVTVRGTVGIEAALFGVVTLTAGTGRYDGLGFTLDSDSKEEYLDRLNFLDSQEPMTPWQVELAEKFAWGVFMARPFRLVSARLDFERDAKASTRVAFTCQSEAEVLNAPDMRAFSDWAFKSDDEDYLDEEAKAELAAGEGA